MTTEKLHIIPHNHDISLAERSKMKDHKPLLIWFTGLSGSGKSTIANELEKRLFEMGVHTYILDGDNVRNGLNSDLDFTEDGRIENIRRIGEVSSLFLDSGLVVLSAFVSPFRSDRALVKKLAGDGNYIEVFVDCPLEVCEARDVKGLYKKARKGEISNFTGISSPFEEPLNADIIVKSDVLSVQQSAEKVYQFIESKLRLRNEV
jgi:adenylylsulfate kinase